ncbi:MULTISPECIES: hypothetical protein [Pseudomonas]|jgi:hypothetical protein|uniref:Uncharacterized protein n=1 Tax=Pseudomonas syringae TaxID=317 RepID=A0A085ULT3_PSESX|nr:MULTISPECIES: hypothetical protein [Pseudomonas]EPJ85321.1 hypothetical protein CFII64_12256 [Pseudomonas sp. CFII64]KFE44146.1 hypothetical protein IV02_30485 [Pseudomonas syringae]
MNDNLDESLKTQRRLELHMALEELGQPDEVATRIFRIGIFCGRLLELQRTGVFTFAEYQEWASNACRALANGESADLSLQLAECIWLTANQTSTSNN